MMPIIWTREYRSETGKTSKIITSTIGSSVDFQSEGLRRVIVNRCYWALGLADQIPPRSDVTYVGDYEPTWFGFGKFKPNLKPSDLEPDPDPSTCARNPP